MADRVPPSDQMRKEIERGIALYVEANKSDPFCAMRCWSHYRNGICDPVMRDGDLCNGHYEAHRDPTGFINVARP